MIESAALIEPGAGDESSSSTVAQLRELCPQRLQQEQANNIALYMFRLRAEGPHMPEVVTITALPTHPRCHHQPDRRPRGDRRGEK